MAKKRPRPKAARAEDRSTNTDPKYPYTITPGALRKFLKQVPEKPRPTKINSQLLKSWGHANTNAGTIIRVLKRLGLVSPTNEPTPDYDAFMHAQTGPAVLGRKIKEVYPELFNASKEPHKEADSSLKNLFNIHAGGNATTQRHQIATFKALCEHAIFDGVPGMHGAKGDVKTDGSRRDGVGRESGNATLHIDLHIHLPADKSSREYQAMFEDIGRYLLGRGQEEEEDV